MLNDPAENKPLTATDVILYVAVTCFMAGLFYAWFIEATEPEPSKKPKIENHETHIQEN